MKELKQLVHTIRPVKTKFNLIRIGGANDGGYLVPNDLSDITACFSPGVADTATFEEDLQVCGIGSHLADASVDGPPKGITPLSFTKKFLGGINDEINMTLDRWLLKEKCNTSKDLILQMDIEGAEYVTIVATPTPTLMRFRIIVLEVHNAHAWFNPISWDIVNTFFKKLTSHHHVVHIHPNNNCSFFSVDNFLVPDTFEITLLRKDRSEAIGYVESFPHPLDAPNVLDKPDRSLPEGWYK